MKNHHLDLVRITEAGAISASEWVGRGNKENADLAATKAMRDRMNKMDFCAKIAIGEGKKDKSYGLYEGEVLGRYINGLCVPKYSIAVDPIEGTTPTAKGGYESMSVIAMANIDCLFKTEKFYMRKLAAGPLFKDKLCIKYPLEVNINTVGLVLGKSIQHVSVCVLDRPRHDDLVKQLREIGCRIKFITDCDVSACIATCEPDSGIDIFLSIGGSPEAVITAAAMKCMGGFFQTQIVDDETMETEEKILGIEDLAKGDTIFSATGITDGKLLKGVRFTSQGPITHSITMRSGSGTIRRIQTNHGN